MGRTNLCNWAIGTMTRLLMAGMGRLSQNGDSMAITEVRFDLHIPADVYVAYYQGQVRDVQVTTRDGVRVRFPARLLRPYVTREGIRGQFILRYDEGRRAVGLERTGD